MNEMPKTGSLCDLAGQVVTVLSVTPDSRPAATIAAARAKYRTPIGEVGECHVGDLEPWPKRRPTWLPRSEGMKTLRRAFENYVMVVENCDRDTAASLIAKLHKAESPHFQARQKHEETSAKIRQLRGKGKTLQQIGDEVGLTRQRISVILKPRASTH